GEMAVRLVGWDAAGNEAAAELAVAVEAAALPRQELQMPAALAGLATGPVAREEAAQMAALTSAMRPERLWTGAFRPPLPAAFRQTTGFGDRRDYADGHVAHHGGYDVAAPLGTRVPVAADGVVTFTGSLQQRGNTVVVDHGWGIYTVYAHLSRFQVEAGQPVAQGQPVGLVGSTGLSTGPHLHWEVRLRGVAIDPGAWIEVSGEVT
ncbi:MAG: M23 family metallopeptidase, partial [Chloroflexota bacterium]